jgi:hypothetical protein
MASNADQAHRDWLRAHLARAAKEFGVYLVGEETFSWHDRTLGARVTTGAGESSWLRVVSEHPHWAGGEFWNGNRDANAIEGVAKPCVLAWQDCADAGRELRAELMTYVPGKAISDEMVLRRPVELDRQWWDSLRSSLDTLADHPTQRVCLSGHHLRLRTLAFFGVEVNTDALERTTAHGDLHWANLTAPRFAVLDWETWGIAPAGYDAAMLYCASLLQPQVAERVYATCADLLDGPAGVVAQLAAAGRLVRLVEDGDHPDLAVPLHIHARTLIGRL